MPILTAQGLTKSFGPQLLLDAVTFTIRSGERVGLVGMNGSGKSTLARILAGLEPADSGEVQRRRGARIAYLAQEPMLDPERTAREVVLAGLGAWSAAKARYDASTEASAGEKLGVEALLVLQADAQHELERLGGWDPTPRVATLLTKLGIEHPEQPVGTMSGGERRRVALAAILVEEPELAILDEPTNHLDAETIEWLEGYLVEDYPGALLLITHDRYVLDRVVERTFELERAKIAVYDGGWEAYLVAKAEREKLDQRTEQNRQNFLRRELEWLSRQPKARTGKQKARIQRAEAARGAIPSPGQRDVDLELPTRRLGGTVVVIQDLALEIAGRKLITDLTLHLTAGERVGVVGRNGLGKTSLLRCLVGEIEPAAGRVVVGKNTHLAYFDQTRAGLDPEASILQNVAGDRRTVELGERELTVYAYLERFLFFGDKQRQPVGSLSGGERARVALAKLLLGGGNVLLLDEPTNDLDVTLLGALEEMLVEFAVTALIITHDRYFLDRVASSLLVFEGEGRVVHQPGNYTSLVERRTLARSGARPDPRSLAVERPVKPKLGLSNKEKLELDALLDRIGGVEGQVKQLEAELADPATYTRGGSEVPRLRGELEAARREVTRLTLRWEELEMKRGESRS